MWSRMGGPLLCLALGGGWNPMEELANRLDARVVGFPVANLPKRGEGHARRAGKLLHLRVTQGREALPNLCGCGYFLFHTPYCTVIGIYMQPYLVWTIAIV